MYLVTLEGLPHAGRCRILRALASLRPDWSAVGLAGNGWSTPSCSATHALFATLLRKTRAVAGLAEHPGVVLLGAPWFEHLPRGPCVQALARDMTLELARGLGCRVRLHVLVTLAVPHDEAFEQMVCSGNPYWNGHALADVEAAEARVLDQPRPFPSVTARVECPPFVEENEVVAHGVARAIVDAVQAAIGERT